MTEFTEWRSLVDGEQIRAIPDDPVFRPDDNDLDKFDGDLGDFDIVESPTMVEDRSLKFAETGDATIFSTNEDYEFIKRGYAFEWYYQEEESTALAGPAFGDSINNFYAVGLGSNDEIRIYKSEDGSVEIEQTVSIDSFDPNEAVIGRVEWQSDEIFVEAFATDENLEKDDSLGTATLSDNDYDGPGLGFYRLSGSDIAYLERVDVTDILD